MGFIKKFFQNTSNPEGTLGKVVVGMMNSGSAKVADWGLTHLGAFSPRVIADIGCGGGRNAMKLLGMYPHAKLFGVDRSSVSVQKATDFNQDAISAGRCRIIQADAADLPFKDGVIDMVTAFETVYFWPGPVTSFREICRVLSDGGVFVIVNETDGCSPDDEKRQRRIEGMNIYTAEELFAALKDAGFSEIGMDRDEENHYLCVLAVK